jgi:SAM-dependent methyltransferase
LNFATLPAVFRLQAMGLRMPAAEGEPARSDHGASAPETFANAAVLAFYRDLPFNQRTGVAEHVRAVTGTDAAAAYPPLPPLLGPGTRVLDAGCGVGWLALGIAHHHGAAVTGIDFNPMAIERAREVARRLNLAADFRVADLFLYEPDAPFDVAIAIGVLHHTNDCGAGLARLARTCVRPGGHLLVGLYHSYGRRPFLDHFRALRAAGASEEEMLARYRRLHSWIGDETQLRSWFRDQVLHPHETQHTLQEMAPVLERNGMRLVSTSINRFQPFDGLDELFEQEKTFAGIAEERLKTGQYFPGFFVFLARKDG